MSAPKRLTIRVSGAIFLGVLAGWACHQSPQLIPHAAQIADGLGMVTETFLRLIKMIIAPLVFSALTASIANMARNGSPGRTVLTTIGWFICAGSVSLALGIVMACLLHPGTGLHMAARNIALSSASGLSIANLPQIVPTSFFAAMSDNSILQVVVFSLFSGAAMAALGERVAPLIRGLDATVLVMLKMTDLVIRCAPVAVFTAIAAAVSTHGISILHGFVLFVASFYTALALLWIVLITVAYLTLGNPAGRFLREMRDPILIAFATASSEAAFALTLERLQKVGVPKRIADFVVPMGLTFNLDGSMMYCAFAVIFLAQAYDVPLSFAQYVAMAALLILASKGSVGVPRGSLVMVAAALPQFNIPIAGMGLLFGVDQVLDMGRSATNVLGNAVATAVIARWEDSGIEENNNEVATSA
jgi:Na+/H+-dicarboxylate symporter